MRRQHRRRLHKRECPGWGLIVAPTKEQDEKPYRDAGYPAGPVSMGGGRKLAPYGKCSKSPDDMHHYTAVSNIQSVEHFVCDFCEDDWWD